jgi:hypothetical protein
MLTLFENWFDLCTELKLIFSGYISLVKDLAFTIQF